MKAPFLRILGSLVASFLLISCVHQAQHPVLSGPQLAQQTAAETVALVTELGLPHDNHGSFCTGLWVDQTHIFTAAHCLEGYAHIKQQVAQFKALVADGCPPKIAAFLMENVDFKSINLKDPNVTPMMRHVIGIVMAIPLPDPMTLEVPYIVQADMTDVGSPPLRLHYSRPTAMNTAQDLAVLQIVGQIDAHPVLELAASSPVVGEEVVIIGHGMGHFWSYRTGVVSAYRNHMQIFQKGGAFMQVSAPMSPGDSGGGTFNSRGQLVGINSFIHSGLAGGFCVHLETIRGFLLGQHLIPSPPLGGQQDKDPLLENGQLNLK